MKNGQLQTWLLGALLAVLITMSGALFTMVNARLDRIDGRLTSIEQQYFRIAVVESEVKEIKRILDREFRLNRDGQ